MAITDVGYNGLTNEVSMQKSGFGRGPARFYCFGPNDFQLSLAGFGGTAAPGVGVGYNITSFFDAPEPVTFGAVSSGTRWDAVVIRRDSTPPTGGTTSLRVIPGGPSPVLPSGVRDEPGVVTDQPLWLVPVTSAGAGVPVDYRTWWGDGGLISNGPEPMQYMDEYGTLLYVRTERKAYRQLGNTGTVNWQAELLGPVGPVPVVRVVAGPSVEPGQTPIVTRSGTNLEPTFTIHAEKGATGAQASGVAIKGTVANQAALPTTGNVTGNAYVVLSPAPAHMWIWSGSAWTDLGVFQGPQGVPGTTSWNGLTDKPSTFAPIVGTAANQAKAGDYQPTAANISDATDVGRAVLKATDAAAARAALKVGSVAVVNAPDTVRKDAEVNIWKGHTTRPTAATAGDIWLKVATD